jgi:hypothetical protein
MSLGLGTTAIFGTGCRYQVPTRTRGDTNGATQRSVRYGPNGRQRDSHDSWSHRHRVLEGIMIKLAVILHRSHFVTLRVTKM